MGGGGGDEGRRMRWGEEEGMGWDGMEYGMEYGERKMGVD